MIKKLDDVISSNDDIVFANGNFGNVTFSSDEMGINSIDLNSINLDGVNFDEDDLESIIHAKLWHGAIDLNKVKYLKKS